MTIIIRAVDAPASEWVYLDNTTNYTDRQSKRLTSNPIEDGNVVTDHSIKENRKFSVAGSVSPWDFHLGGGLDRIDSDGYSSVTSVGTIKVDNNLSDYLPSSISQYTDFASESKEATITQTTPSVSRESYLNSVLVRLQSLYESDSLIDVYFADYSGEGNSLIKNVVMTSLVISEDLNTGDSRRVDMSFEQPTIAYISTTTVPSALVKELAEQEAKGNVTSTKVEDTGTIYEVISEKVINPFFNSITGG